MPLFNCSLMDLVQDNSIKPQLQCIVEDPTFSMVTVQSEDSGIVWETASSRCSTPWASEASTTSDAYSLEGSLAGSTSGKVVFIMDENKIVRRRKKASLGGRVGESKSRSQGENSKQFPRKPIATHPILQVNLETTKDPDGEKELFNIVCEGYEILNIIVPPKMLTVDEEESSYMPDNLSYLEENPLIKSKVIEDLTEEEQAPMSERETEETVKKVVSESKTEAVEQQQEMEKLEENESINLEKDIIPNNLESEENAAEQPPKRNGNGDLDYFEKFTLLDDHVPETKPLDTENEPSTTQEQESPQSISVSKDSNVFVFVDDVEIASEHLDEVFYGSHLLHDPEDYSTNKQNTEDETEVKADASQKCKPKFKKSGTALFSNEEESLTRCYYTTTTKIIDQFLLEEPPAMSFLYTDLYEQAVGEKKKDDSEPSDEESVVSEGTFTRRLSDTEDNMGGYFEKYSLKDDVPLSADEPQTEEDQEGVEVRMWCQDEFKLTGSITEEKAEAVIREVEVFAEPSGRIPELSPCEENDQLFAITEEISEDLDFQPVFEDENTVLTEEMETVSKSPELSDETLEVKETQPMEEQSEENLCVPHGTEISYVSEHAELSEDIHKLSQLGKEDVHSEPELYQGHEEEAAETLGYEMVTQQEVQEDCTASEADLLRDREYVSEGTEEHLEQGYDFVDEIGQVLPAVEAEYEIIEDLGGTPISEGELEQKEPKKPTLDTFCLTCRCPISAIDKLFGDHQDHSVSTLDKAHNDIKNKLTELIADLQGRTEKIEDLVAELELAFNTVEENCTKAEQGLDEQNDEMMKTVLEQYEDMSQKMEDEKKHKLEQLYDQIVTFQESIESAKETLEKTVKEVEQPDELAFVTSAKDINRSLNKALQTTVSLELTPSAFPVFEDYAKSTSGNGHKLLKGIAVNRRIAYLQHCSKQTALTFQGEFLNCFCGLFFFKAATVSLSSLSPLSSVPQTPRVQPQEANSATSTSVTVYWKVNEGDVIDCFQVYCMEEPQGAMSEEYRVTVKESYCTLEDLEPDKCYLVWVMAVNYTGCSLPSEKTSFRTAPSSPMIKTEECTVCWDSATIRWSSPNLSAVESFTLEYCRQYACEGEGLRSISGVRNCEQKVLLHPNENYLFYIKAVNYAGASEQSEAALISTKGKALSNETETLLLSDDKTTIHYPEHTFRQRATLNDCLGILGELLPPRGYHYWETAVGGSEAYRIGVAYPSTPHDSPLGQNSTSWCIHCYTTPTSCRFEFLHNSVQADIQVVDVPERIGTLLNYRHGRLLFFNPQNGQLLCSCRHRFTEACHPALAVEKPGSLTLHTGMEMPELLKHS
ncbi:CMYA5 protein, partial [Amia calva]|nr:CMYA5 protein [Amia calva]